MQRSAPSAGLVGLRIYGFGDRRRICRRCRWRKPVRDFGGDGCARDWSSGQVSLIRNDPGGQLADAVNGASQSDCDSACLGNGDPADRVRGHRISSWSAHVNGVRTSNQFGRRSSRYSDVLLSKLCCTGCGIDRLRQEASGALRWADRNRGVSDRTPASDSIWFDNVDL